MPSWKKAATAISSVKGFRDYQRDESDGFDIPRTGGSQSGEPNTHAQAYPHPPPPRRNHPQPQQIAASSGVCQFQCLYCDFCGRVCRHGSFANWVRADDGQHSGQCPGRVNQSNSPPALSNMQGSPGSYPPQSGSPIQQQGMYTGAANQQYGQSPPPDQQYSPPPSQEYSPPPQGPTMYSSYPPQQPSQTEQATSAPRSFPSNNYGAAQPQQTYGNAPQYTQSRYTTEPQGYPPSTPQMQRATTWHPSPGGPLCPNCSRSLHSSGHCPYCYWGT